MKLLFCTQNDHKLAEIKALFQREIELISLNDLHFQKEIVESGATLEENSLIKARIIYNEFKIPCFADDSGLEVNALNGAPGVFSARYAGDSKDDQLNIEKLLKELDGKRDRLAQFRTIITYMHADGYEQFEGTVIGEILLEKMGDKGFGYDPIFRPLKSNLSFGQMTMEEKNCFSHRKLAMQKFINFLAIK